MKKRTLYDSFEIRGKWSIPNSDHSVSGTIHSDKNEFNLTTEGIIGGQEDGFVESLKNFSKYPELIPIIHGMLVTGEKVTLTNNRLVREIGSYPGITICTYHIENMFIGERYSSKDSIEFDKLVIDYSNLKHWYGFSGFEKADITKNLWGATVKIKDVIEKLNDDVTIKIRTSPNYLSEMEERKVTISESNSWIIESKKKMSFEEFYQLANCFRHYLMLGMGVGTYFVTLTGMLEKTEIEIYLTRTIVTDKLTTRHDHDMFFRYYDVKENFDEHLKKWHSLWNKFYDVLVSYFSTVDRPEQYMLESQFLTLAVALESFHRIKYNDLTSSFHERMDELVNNNKSAFDDADKEKNTFIESVKNTRNYFAHGNDDDKLKAKTNGTDLLILVNEMQILIEMCLINELPFDKKTSETIAYKNRKEKNYFRDNKE